ncbi:aquaporin Z [Litoreibacter meonggei]|uniref:Aquaporin Z n=1 Tax=Litoreibacter meonggei TaxID=1049199 RepID=A0A497X6F9_9RHOB|nr:aquaporin Z [Litoreibacter meonggei]RLJ60691.1 aquaporin Z [Litoreibacter meonggei]
MNKYVAEAFGTFVLVFFGVGSAVLAGGDIGFTGISFAFGISVIAMAYSIGQVSGAHLNPAVSMGALVAGRIDMKDFIGYSVSQTIGAIVAAAFIYIIATGKTAGYDVAASGLGQNGWGADYLGGFGMMAAFTFEVVATAVFLVVILGVTAETGNSAMAGLVIGLTLVMIHLIGIPVTGTSVNPARSIGPALFAGPTALSQLWLFIVAPLLGGALGGFLHKARITSP